ncbi:hypothetical protein TTHERM_01063940 (macronuclear) [Tetrahymena thermophila SB210]|uniref:Kinase domain protein n=1 Tax=Tetrahymena thermophila (strain SB210) TaxID=312017 RepID=Q22KV1_TETTS|nr:hypothetical protein TTHERM_01063940 [Tetrahymena thermophila SB210]EAR85927.2 hypothetical protein TTHERM_01063940 [Tetrahymena thermophila SB210]|eukprot:XP_976522.2 hypothetical protein TTHERM_01063940 [Tetrahymena thermophila SB210]
MNKKKGKQKIDQLKKIHLIDLENYNAQQIQDLKEVSLIQKEIRFYVGNLYKKFAINLRPFNEQDAQQLSQEISQLFNKIEKLQIVIMDDNFELKYLQLIGNAISQCQNLIHLNIFINGIKHIYCEEGQISDYVIFTQQISQCKDIQYLNLLFEEGYIDDQICFQMLKSLQSLPKLSQIVLNLVENPLDISQDDWQQFIQTFTGFHNLNYLVICFNGEQTSKFMKMLAQRFKKVIKKLIHLRLSWMD